MGALNLEIEIGPGNDGGYPVTARGPGGGEAAATMLLPLSGRDLESQLAAIKDAVLASSAIHRRIPTPQERPVQEFGRSLFDALFTGDVRVLFGASYQQARQQGVELRLVLRIQPPEVARLPWEFLFRRRPGRLREPAPPAGALPAGHGAAAPAEGRRAAADLGHGRAAQRPWHARRRG